MTHSIQLLHYPDYPTVSITVEDCDDSLDLTQLQDDDNGNGGPNGNGDEPDDLHPYSYARCPIYLTPEDIQCTVQEWQQEVCIGVCALNQRLMLFYGWQQSALPSCAVYHLSSQGPLLPYEPSALFWPSKTESILLPSFLIIHPKIFLSHPVLDVLKYFKSYLGMFWEFSHNFLPKSCFRSIFRHFPRIPPDGVAVCMHAKIPPY